jgi:hypothetical protein
MARASGLLYFDGNGRSLKAIEVESKGKMQGLGEVTVRSVD